MVTRRRTARPDFDDPASVRAVGALADLTVLAETERIRAFLGELHRLRADLRDATGVLKAAIWATPEELQELSRDVLALVDRFSGRWENAVDYRIMIAVTVLAVFAAAAVCLPRARTAESREPTASIHSGLAEPARR